MRESRGDVTEAGPSIAVQMVGLNTVPIAGDEFCVCSSEQEVHLFLTNSTSLAMRSSQLPLREINLMLCNLGMQ